MLYKYIKSTECNMLNINNVQSSIINNDSIYYVISSRIKSKRIIVSKTEIVLRSYEYYIKAAYPGIKRKQTLISLYAKLPFMQNEVTTSNL